MFDHDPVTAQLEARYNSCLTTRRQRRILDRWSTSPALSGRSVEDLVAVLYDRSHPDHNPIAAALLAAHRDGDDDASTVLLTALRPLVVALDGRAARPERHADLWAAVGKRLATTTPADVTALGPDRPFLALLLGRLRRDAARLHAEGQRGRLPSSATGANPTSGEMTGCVDDVAVARCELAAIARHVRRGDITAVAWEQLVAHRLHDVAHPGTASRNRVSRTGRRLAHLVGHSAA